VPLEPCLQLAKLQAETDTGQTACVIAIYTWREQ